MQWQCIRMDYRLWCVVVLTAAALLTVQGGAVKETKQGQQCPGGGACLALSVLRPFQDLIANRRRGLQLPVRDAECGRGDGKDMKVHCSETSESSRTRPIPSSSPTRVPGEDLLPQENECGQSPELETRIWQGEDAPLSAYPWMALLGSGDPDNPSWTCGGFLINDRYVLTAAHCVQKESYRNSMKPEVIRLGEHNKSSDPDCPESISLQRPCAPSPQDFTPEEITIHETYGQRALYSDDIALIRLNKKVTMSDSVGPVCIPPADLDVAQFLGSRDALVAGWGKTETGFLAEVLQVASLPFANKRVCQLKYYLFTKLVEEQVCFGGRGVVNAFRGDSGGPVFQTDVRTSRYTVLGVASFTMQFFQLFPIPGFPSVYTSVAHYRKWITDNLKP